MGANGMRMLQRLTAWMVGALALVASMATLAQAPDQTLFGPQQYVRTAGGAPNVYVNTFSVPAGVGTPFVLRIVNGSSSGTRWRDGGGDDRDHQRDWHSSDRDARYSGPRDDRDRDDRENSRNRVTSGSVKLNGVQIVGPADFRRNVATIERTVTLLPNNTLEVRLASAPGGFITLSVLGTRIPSVPTSLTPNPLAVIVGATGALTATLAPPPLQAGTLAVSSANPAAASVPAAVPFAVGQTSVSIPVTAVGSGTTTITASANGSSASATVNVTPAPPTIASLTPPTLTVTQSSQGSLTATISAAQAGDTSVAVASSNSAVASVPSTVIVPAGQVTAVIPVGAVSPGDAQITASLNGTNASSRVTVTPLPPTVVSLLPAVSTVTLGASTQLTLTISAAQPTDTNVPLGVTPGGIVTAPAEAVVLAGQTQGSITVGSLAYGQAGITATLNNSSASAAVNVVPPPVAVTAIEPATFTMNVGATSTFTVRINAAQVTNTEIALESGNPAVLQVPASVTVAQGATSATFTATGLAVGDSTLTASANGTSRTASVHVSPQPAAIVSLLPSPLPLQQGATGHLTVTINVAQETDTPIVLANTDPAVATVPASVTVLAGAISAQISVTAVAPGGAQVTASVNGTSAAASVEVTPPPPIVTSITPAALSLPKGTPGVLRVNVSRAPNVATAVTLVSSDPGVASLPPQVNIPAGALYAEFPVTTNSVGQATVTAMLNNGLATSLVTVAPAELVTLTLSPQTPTNYVGEAVPFTATGTMTDGTTEDFTSRVTWSSSDTGVATIGAGGVANPLAAGQTTIKAEYAFTAVQTNQPVTVTQSTVLTVKTPTPLLLSAPSTTLQVTQSAIVTVTTSDPPPFGGLQVFLTASGAGSATFPPSVTIPEYETSATFQLTGAAPGDVTLTAVAQNRLPATIAFTIAPQFAITSFTPTTGPVGTAVAITGVGFDPNLSGNQVKFAGETAVLVSGNATTLNAIVPPRAITGPISVTNFRGTATSSTPFTVQEREAFDITLAPASIQVPPGGYGATKLKLTSTGLNPYPYGASVAVTGLPSGVTVTFDRPLVALNQDVIATFNASAGAGAGTFQVTITTSGASGVRTAVVTKTLALQVFPAGSTTVTGRVLHAEDAAPFVGARIRLGGAHVFTDETGTYRFINPPLLDDQVVLIDGHTNNTPQFQFPSAIAMAVMIVANRDNKALTSYIQRIDATKFTAIVPGQAATVTNPEIPNFSLNIPQGATLFGWDGTPIDKVNVRVVPVDRLPIKPIPDGFNTKSVYLYYFFREGGANPTQPIPVTMANDLGAAPGEQIELWYYDESITPDPNSNQWKLMGMGTVSDDGLSIVSNPGVGIPKFCCGASFPRRLIGFFTGANAGNGNGPCTANPVDLGSGNASAFRQRPFGIDKLMSLDLNCRYRSTDNRIGIFGRGTSFTYDWSIREVFVPYSCSLPPHLCPPPPPPRLASVVVTNPQGVQFSLNCGGVLYGGPHPVCRAVNGPSLGFDMTATRTDTGWLVQMSEGDQLEFGRNGFATAIKDAAGNRISIPLDRGGFPTGLVDPTGKLYVFERVTADVAGSQLSLVTKITDPAGRFIRFEYDANQRLQRYTDQGGGVTVLEYDAAGRISRSTDPRGAVKTFEYDGEGRTVRETLPEGGEEKFVYSGGRNVTETAYTDANGNKTAYRWNTDGFGTAVIDALGRVTKVERDPITSRVKRRIDPMGRVTQYFYNSRGDLTRLIDADNKETKIDYDPRFRRPTRIENALGYVTMIEYNAQALPIRIVNAENEATVLTYTSHGKLQTVTDPLSRVTEFTYDENGNLVAMTNAAGELTRANYDSANRLVQMFDALDRVTRFAYDNIDRVKELVDAAQGVTRYTYDANDNLLSVTDPKGNLIEQNTYDLRNRLTQRTDAKNISSQYEYDAVGNLIRLTDRKGQLTSFAYDALNRLREVSDTDGRITTYAYDLSGNLSRISDGRSGDILMSYDALDRVSEIVSGQGTVAYAYDAIGRRTARMITGGDVTTYTYDKANRVKTVTLREKTVTYNYDAAGRLSSKVLPNGLTANYLYDLADRLTSITYSKLDPSTLTPVPVETVTYAYDPAGQRIAKGVGASSLQETPFTATYDDANRMTSITLAGETFVLTYDANGNLVTKSGPATGTTAYTWDARGQLIAISAPRGLTAAFSYDAVGRRIEKVVNGETTGYLYDGPQAIAELKGSVLNTVYHTGLAIDEILARYAPSGNKTLLTDALMSVTVQTSDGANAENFYAYSPFGEVAVLGPDDSNVLRYTGREDDGTGLYFYRARYYDPLLKRFISEDPIGLAGGDVNFYAYVRSNPLNMMDPDGRIGVPGAVVGGLVGGGLYVVGQVLAGQPVTSTGLLLSTAAGAASGMTGAYIFAGAMRLGLSAAGTVAVNAAGNAAANAAMGTVFGVANNIASNKCPGTGLANQAGWNAAFGAAGGYAGARIALLAPQAGAIAQNAANQIGNLLLPRNPALFAGSAGPVNAAVAGMVSGGALGLGEGLSNFPNVSP